MTLQDYLSDYLGNLQNQLGWSASSLTLVVTDTISAYGVDTEEEATDTKKLYSLGIYYLWKKVVRELTMNVDYSADGVSLKLSQQVDNAKSQLKQATADAMQYLPDNSIKAYKFHNHISGCVCYHDDLGRHYVPYFYW